VIGWGSALCDLLFFILLPLRAGLRPLKLAGVPSANDYSLLLTAFGRIVLMTPRSNARLHF
jgi:hypothetical protein